MDARDDGTRERDERRERPAGSADLDARCGAGAAPQTSMGANEALPVVRRRNEAAEFRRLMGALVGFARDLLGIEASPAGDALAGQDAASDVLDALWDRRWLIRRFIESNTPQLSEADSQTVSLWSYALVGRFVVTDAEGRLMALLTTDLRTQPRLILANFLERQAEDTFDALPCLAELVLLPYHGRIVTDGRIKRVSSVVMPEGTELIKQRLGLAMESPPIACANDLITLSRCERRYATSPRS